MKDKKFNYAVGFYWNDDKGSVGCYNLFGEVHYGTLKEAKNLQKYCSTKADNLSAFGETRKYKIFVLNELEVKSK